MSTLYGLLTDTEFLITIFVAIAAFATIITFAMPWLQRDKLSSRLKLVANQREELRKKSRAELNTKKDPAKLRATSSGFKPSLC